MVSASNLYIALVQCDLVWEKPDDNRNHIAKLIENLQQGVDLIVLPEMFVTGFSMQVDQFAEDMDGLSVKWLMQLARKYQAVIAGSLMIKEDGRFFNRFVFAWPDGRVDFYNKRHLFSMGKENLYFTAGKERKVFDVKGFRILPQVCYDLRFPVFSRNRNDYDLLINCANWPAPRQEVWKTLLKARAIENQSYVAGVNRIGVDVNGIKYQGGSQIVDPKGTEINIVQGSESIITAILNKPILDKFRRNFPVLNDADDFSFHL